MILLDTCALIWYTVADEMLSPKAKNAIEKSQNRIISSISIWEIGIKIKNNKLELPISYEAYVDRIKQIQGISILPIDESIWMDSIKLLWNHKDPADRVIVATAKRLAIPVVTIDKEIIKFYKKSIW